MTANAFIRGPPGLPGRGHGRPHQQARWNPRVLYAALLMFVERHGDDAGLMLHRLQQGDAAGVGHLAHALKAAADNLGARQVHAAAEALELAARGHASTAQLQGHIQQLAAALRALLDPLQAALGADAPA
jgi:HPt (histidine-containing phosphotransfer) domain-containing protein